MAKPTLSARNKATSWQFSPLPGNFASWGICVQSVQSIFPYGSWLCIHDYFLHIPESKYFQKISISNVKWKTHKITAYGFNVFLWYTVSTGSGKTGDCKWNKKINAMFTFHHIYIWILSNGPYWWTTHCFQNAGRVNKKKLFLHCRYLYLISKCRMININCAVSINIFIFHFPSRTSCSQRFCFIGKNTSRRC